MSGGWRITDHAIECYQRARAWRVDDRERARRELSEMMPAANYRDGVEHLERWRSPKRHGGLRWLIDTRAQTVIWVGFGAPPIAHFLDRGDE